MATKLEGADLAHLFGIDLAPSDEQGEDAARRAMCPKCKGKGNFFSYTGRVVGPCFTCNGSGLAAQVAPVKPGDCDKCNGSGAWRPGLSCFACDGTGKLRVAATAAVDVSAIATAFATAFGQGIKRPKVRLGDFQFSRAPDTGRNAGAIYVTRGGEYLGKVSAGTFTGTRACDDPTTAAIVEVASDPASAAKAYGQRTGSCSCCGRELTDPVSIAAGIGPICAERFGF